MIFSQITLNNYVIADETVTEQKEDKNIVCQTQLHTISEMLKDYDRVHPDNGFIVSPNSVAKEMNSECSAELVHTGVGGQSAETIPVSWKSDNLPQSIGDLFIKTRISNVTKTDTDTMPNDPGTCPQELDQIKTQILDPYNKTVADRKYYIAYNPKTTLDDGTCHSQLVRSGYGGISNNPIPISWKMGQVPNSMSELSTVFKSTNPILSRTRR